MLRGGACGGSDIHKVKKASHQQEQGSNRESQHVGWTGHSGEYRTEEEKEAVSAEGTFQLVSKGSEAQLISSF